MLSQDSFSSNNPSSASNQDRIFVVTDVKAQAILLLVGVGAIVISFMGLFLIGIPVAIACFYRYKIVKAGIVLNLNTGRLQFPGGQIEANSITDYLQKDFLLQLFKRFDVAISDIQHISKRITPHVSDKGAVSYTYALNMTGSFGSATVTFTSEGKCDQCFAMIVQANNMGIPVSNR